MKRITVPVDSPAVLHGVGLFETVLVVRGVPILFGEHFDRLRESAFELGFPAITLEEVVGAIGPALREVEALAEAYLRIVYAAAEREIDERRAWRLIASSGPIPRTTISRRRNGRVILLDPSLRRALPMHKTTSYLPAVLALRTARAAAADEGIFTGARGAVLEGTATNVFAARGDVLATPPLSGGILDGIMRRWVIENAPRLGLRVRERKVSREDILAGSFMTGSLTGFVAIRRVDGEPVANVPEALSRIRSQFQREVIRPAASVAVR